MKIMSKRLLVILALAIIALNAVSFSYAYTSGGIHVDCYCPCDVAFVSVSTSDNENVKDVANTYATISCDKNSIQVTITNAYPYYEGYVRYTIKNKGSKPIHIDSINLINPNPEAINVTSKDLVCNWLQPCQMLQGNTTVRILQPAKENFVYTFQIKIGTSCQMGYPRTIGFWKHQFKVALGMIRGSAQVPPSTLEAYLNQISPMSAVFEFTGTRNQKFTQALAILEPSSYSNMELKLKSQLLALWLNYVAGWTGGYTVDGMTAQQIIQGSENALLNHRTWEYEYWKNMCDRFNNLGGG